MRVSLKGIHKVRKRLANGQVRFYFYAWRGGPRIEAEPGTREFTAEYIRLTRARAEARPKLDISELIRRYVRSPEYRSLARKTQIDYERVLGAIEKEFHDLPLAAVEERGSRALFIEWRNSMSDRPRSADLAMSVLRRILSYAQDHELILRNPVLDVKKLWSGSRADIIWRDEDIAKVIASAPGPIVDALTLAMWTGQRQGDLLRLTWSSYDGSHISLRQSKTKALVRFKVAKPLKDMLDAKPRSNCVTILTNSRGEPWTSDGFRASWSKALKQCGVEGLTFHDLRGTFITVAHRAGSSYAQIAEVSGHSERHCERIIRQHYLAGNDAIERIENGTQL